MGKQDIIHYHNRTLKYLEISLRKIMQEVYEDKYKTLLRELEDDLSEWTDQFSPNKCKSTQQFQSKFPKNGFKGALQSDLGEKIQKIGCKIFKK